MPTEIKRICLGAKTSVLKCKAPQETDFFNLIAKKTREWKVGKEAVASGYDDNIECSKENLLTIFQAGLGLFVVLVEDLKTDMPEIKQDVTTLWKVNVTH